MRGLRLSSLSGRFLALVALLVVTLSVTMTTLATDREARALFAEGERTARTTGNLVEPSAINWVLRGNVSDLDQALRAVRAQDGVTDAAVLDAEGRVLADGTGRGPGRAQLAGARKWDALAAPTALVIRHGDRLDAINPLETSGRRLGTLVVGYDLTAASRPSAAPGAAGS